MSLSHTVLFQIYEKQGKKENVEIIEGENEKKEKL